MIKSACWPGPVFCLLIGVSSGCAPPITGQVTSGNLDEVQYSRVSIEKMEVAFQCCVILYVNVFSGVFFKLILRIFILSVSVKMNHINDKSLILRMTWCQQAASLTWANVDLDLCRNMAPLSHNFLRHGRTGSLGYFLVNVDIGVSPNVSQAII